MGYWIGKKFWGKGIATQSLTAFLEQVEVRPLYAHVAKHNVGSIRVLGKCGFLAFNSQTIYSEGHGREIQELVLILR